MSEIFSKTFEKKRERNGNLIYDHDLTNLRFDANLFSIKIYFAITACMTYAFTFRKC